MKTHKYTRFKDILDRCVPNTLNLAVGILMTLKLIYQTGLIYWIAHIFGPKWHLDVGLSFPKSVGSLIGGSAH